MLTNQQLLARAETALDSLGISKNFDGAMTVGNTNFDGILPMPLVHKLINLTRAQGLWVSNLNNITVDRSVGTVPILKVNGNITEGREENEAATVIRRAATKNVPYVCKAFTSEWEVTVQQLREAEAAGITNFEDQIMTSFGIARANDKANIIVNGDTTLDASTSLNKMLRMVDGFEKLSAAGNVYDALGAAFGQGVFAYAMGMLPNEFQGDPKLRFLYGPRVDAAWRATLTNVNNSTKQNTVMGDQVLTGQFTPYPEGVPQLIIPQMGTSKGGTAAAPTDVTNNGTTLTFRVATILADATSAADRAVIVTCKISGAYELCRVTRNGSSQNVITTASLLRQSSPSVTASDYTVRVADLTSIHHGNPEGITVVDCTEMRSYRQFVPRAERWEIITHWEMAVLMATPECWVTINNVLLPHKWGWA